MGLTRFRPAATHQAWRLPSGFLAVVPCNSRVGFLAFARGRIYVEVTILIPRGSFALALLKGSGSRRDPSDHEFGRLESSSCCRSCPQGKGSV